MIYEVMQWVASVAAQCKPPYLEVGSRQVQSPLLDLRPFFKGRYVGLDMEAGDGVDVVADFEQEGWQEPERFNTVICTDTLEHMREPKLALEHMHEALNPGGICVISVPFCWYLHDHPYDYWRMTPDALEHLLKGAGFMKPKIGMGGAPLKLEWHPPGQKEPYQATVWSHTLAVAAKAVRVRRRQIDERVGALA